LATRVFEIARELDVTSKQVLEKCRAEGLDIKNHMSSVSAGLEATIREWFSEAQSATAVETTKHVNIAKAREEARKQRRRRKNKAEGAPGGVEEASAETQVAVAEAPPTETPVEAEAAADQTPTAEAPPETKEDQTVSTDETQAEAPPAEAPEQLEPQAPPEGETPGEEQAEAPAAPTEPEKPEEPEEPPETVKPAGPQVVPKPARLKGPRVVRVERPDFGTLQRRPKPSPRADLAKEAQPPADKKGKPGTARDEERRGKKFKRRSPRRRGGRSADSGEKLREWRNQDLLERSERLAAAGGGLRRRRASVSRGRRQLSAKMGKIEIAEPITIKSFSAATGIRSAQIIKRLMSEGVMATINQVIGRELAEAVAMDYDIELVVERARSVEEELLEKLQARGSGQMHTRAPVVTFLGHVDHGKTSLLDRIRNTAVAEGEAGGITQHMGAYRYDKDDVQVVFLDTPGHEAFTAMRARGANMTDVVVLVVAADDGVMPQTVEAINHARAAKVPIVVALNKIDLPNANVQRALGQLAERDLQPREWGGDVEVIRTSATTGEGIENLVELLSLEAELLELKAETDAPASGFVIEAEMNPGRGVLARLLIRNGTLKVGDMLLAGKGFGRVRQILDDRGRSVEQSGPATPVEVSGLDEVPDAGDRFYVTENIDQARRITEERRHEARMEELAAVQPKTLEDIFSRISAGQANVLPVIVKADVQGSVEALIGSLNKLGTDEVSVNVLHSGVGGISAGDVTLAEASEAMVIGFNVVPDASARQQAEEHGVRVRLYRVIYDIIEDIRKAMEEGLAPEIREETLGRAEIRQTFKVSRVGTVAGCFVTDGIAARNAHVRIIRDSIVVEDDRSLESLRRFKDDAREVRAGLECGLKIAGYDDVKEGDVLEFYQQVEVARTL